MFCVHHKQMQKKPDVKYTPSAGVFRFLRAASLALPLITLTVVDSGAASWQWGVHGQRERVIITLDSPQPGVSISRTGGNVLLLRLADAQNIASRGGLPEGAASQLVSGITPTADGLELALKTPAFGYLVNKTDPRKLVIDIYHDPLGARWTASGTLAPAAVAERFRAPLAAPVKSAPPALTPSTPVAQSAQKAPMEAQLRSGIAEILPSAPSDVPPEDDAHLPVMEASASLRPPMLEVTPSSLKDSLSAVAQQGGQILDSLSLSTMAAAAESALPGVAPDLPAGERGNAVTPQEVFGKINAGGPENWPNNEALGTSLPSSTPSVRAPVGAVLTEKTPAETATPLTPPADSPVNPSVNPPDSPQASSSTTAPVAPPPTVPTASVQSVSPPPTAPGPATAAPAPSSSPAFTAEVPQDSNVVTMRQSASPAPSTNATASTNSTRPVIYMDEAGNIVPKPPEPDKMLAEAERLLESTQYKEALDLLGEIKALTVITPQMREKVLYLISDATESLYASDALKGFEPITSTTSEALNANVRSARVPDALFRLGMAHLRVKNFGEAEGYFKALKRRFPHDMNVPVAFVNLGKVQLEKGMVAQAADNFRQVLQEYPETNVLREAAVGLVRALVRKGDNAEAVVIADFVDKRWPRHHLNDPAFLEVLAQLNLRQGKLEEALQQFWLHYNLDPARESNADILATIGDIYLRTHRPKAAFEIFSEIRRRYPDSGAAWTALLRLSEKGIHDGPITLESMFKVYDNPGNPAPQVAYRELMTKDAGSSRAVLAGLKLAIWNLWSKQYTDAMGAAADFIDLHPEHADVEQAREVIMRSFMADLKLSLEEENYGRVLILWNGFPLVRQRYGTMDPPLRYALGRGYLERGDDAKAMELFAEFLKTPKDARYSDATFALYFNKYLQAGNWNALLDLGDTVKEWDITPELRSELDYTLALSAENLGLAPRALPLWKKISSSPTAQLYQRAYAYYFLAKDAEQRKDIRDAYTYNKEGLALFGRLEQERSDKADPERVKESIGSLMDITEVANRIPEALEWVERYNDFVPENSPEFPGLRFREARLYRKLGDNAKAKSLLELIVKKAPGSPFAKAAESELRTFAVSRDLRDLLPPPAAPQ